MSTVALTTENIADLDAKSLRTATADEINTPVTFEEALASSGLNEEEYSFISSPYTVLKDDGKMQLENVPFYVKAWNFSRDTETGNPYVILYVVTKNNDMFIITDGSTGIFAQMTELTKKRIAQGHAHPVEHLMVANGLRVSEYALHKENGELRPAKAGEKVDGKGRTFYLA